MVNKEINIQILEEAAENYRRKSYNAAMIPSVDGPTNEYGGSVKEAFKAGAEWMRKKDVEDMYMSDNRHFLKCYEQGKKDMKGQMMSDAKIAEVHRHGEEIRVVSDWIPRGVWNDGDKLKIIIIKDNEND